MGVVELLRKLGFSEYEVKVYSALVELNSASASQISRASNVPRNKTYEVLEKLKLKGFLMELPAKPKKFKVLSLEKLKETINEKRKELDALEKDAESVISNLSRGRNENFQELVWVIKGQKNIVQKIAFEMKNVKYESFACTRNSVDSGTLLRNTKEAIDRGVKVKIIAALNKNNAHKVKKLIEAGAEFRVYDEKKFGPYGTRFSIFDNRAARVTIGRPEVKNPEDYTTIWAESPSLVNILKRQFLYMWSQCKPVKFRSI